MIANLKESSATLSQVRESVIIIVRRYEISSSCTMIAVMHTHPRPAIESECQCASDV